MESAPLTLSVATLPWLASPPPDFRARCKALDASTPGLGGAVQFLALHRLSGPQATSLGNAIKRCQAAGADFAPLAPFKLGYLSSSTSDLIVDGLAAAAARHGVALEVTLAPYDQVMQQALEPASEINRAMPDAVLVAVDHTWLGLARPALDDDASQRVDAAIAHLTQIISGLTVNSGATAILQTLAAPPVPFFGSFDSRFEGSPRALVSAFNLRLLQVARETGSLLLDVAALAERVGTDLWFDPLQWNLYKLPFAAEHVGAYADLVGRLLGAVRGKARKCLVLDLDNTCWGGVIGDDGLDGIVVGQGSATGEAFLAVQQLALDLRERGIILAVSSKNDEVNARAPFREHPDMLLRERHLTVFQANWQDKSQNLEAIARELNIGVDALVFLDDNAAERAHVRAALPMVAVPELPQDPSWYPRYLAAAGYFEAVAFSSEDRQRVDSYTANARRAEVMASTREVGDYLSGLGMVMSFAPFNAQGRARISQLANKSNQFNLTTIRYTEAEIAALEIDSAAYTLQVRLRDSFGDFGMIGVVIARPSSIQTDSWEIESWLMSCRVLGRKVEDAMLCEIARAATDAGARQLIGLYRPTAKNGMVAGHYPKLGFVPLEDRDGARQFALDLQAYGPPDLPMQIERSSQGQGVSRRTVSVSA